MPSITQLAALAAIDPERAVLAILDALEQGEGRRDRAARVLGVSQRTLYRWIGQLDAWDRIDAHLDALGHPRLPGPPRA